MARHNLRHLRLLVAVAETGSATQAAGLWNISQPAVTQAIANLERAAGGALFHRGQRRLAPTPRGMVLLRRVRRALALLEPALAEISPRLPITATAAQLRALVAVCEAENFTLAGRALGLAQPTIHRAVANLEHAAGRALFERSDRGIVPYRQTRALAQAVRLGFAELEQAESDLAEMDGGAAGRLVVGALPLSRSVLLPHALIALRRQRPLVAVTVIDGRYDALLAGLRSGDIDVIVGALRYPAPIADVVQERLFDDGLSILSGTGHPLVAQAGITRADLLAYPWIVPPAGTPTRRQFDDFFASDGPPPRIIEAGSVLLMREILADCEHLGCISRAQAQAEIANGLLHDLKFDGGWAGRPIGLTYRARWEPTAAQALLLDLLRETAGKLA